VKHQKKRRKHRYPGVTKGIKSGTFIIQWEDHKGIRRTRTIHTSSEREAHIFRQQILIRKDRIKYGFKPLPEMRQKDLMLSELWDNFQISYQLKVDSGSMKQKSLDRIRQSVEALIDYYPTLASTLITKISKEDFEGFKIYRQSKGFAPQGINTILRNLRTVFNYAVKRGLLKQSPIQDVANIKISKQDVRYLTKDELRILFFTLEQLNLNDEFQKDARDLVLFYLHTGARASEALFPNFTWDCVRHNSIVFPETKTYMARSIPLSQQVKQILDSRRHIPDSPFHFTIHTVSYRTRFIFKKAGLKDITTHNLRKTAGAYYYFATRDIFAASRFLGHSSVKITESHYCGLIQSLQTEYSEAYERTLSNLLNGSTLNTRFLNTSRYDSILIPSI